MPAFLIPWIVAGAGIAAAGFLWWRLDAAHERIGALDNANKQLTTALEAKQNALNSRARTDDAVRKLGPDDVLERLR